MLEQLKDIVQEVNSAKDLRSALDLSVARIAEVMGVEVCTIYLRDRRTNRLVFMANEGLNKSLQGKISLAFEEGLVGQVAQRAEPINLDDAVASPHFMHLPGIGEEPFHSFMGTPIIHQREVLGVMVVQQRQPRKFDQEEEAFLVTLGAQLSGVIAHASVMGVLDGLSQWQTEVGRYEGVAGSSGIGLGQAVFITPKVDLYSVPPRATENVELEQKRFSDALEAVRTSLDDLTLRLKDSLSSGDLAVFDAYKQMLDDPSFVNQIIDTIDAGEWAPGAVSQVVLGFVSSFESIDDDYLRERASDIRDVGIRLLEKLDEGEPLELDFPEKTILIAEEITTTMLGDVPTERLAGLVSLRGSGNSHVAILARSMGVPAVLGVESLRNDALSGKRVIVDGYAGLIFIEPSESTENRYQDLYEEELLVQKGLKAQAGLPAQTEDGRTIHLLANVGLITDLPRAREFGAEGIGLYRSEIPFLLSQRFPSEEEQRLVYKEHLDAFSDYSVTMRTLDIGGDKPLPYFPIQEDNPFLGWRGIRVTLDHPEIFLVQLRAMMKASEGQSNLRIMLPMITNLDEVLESRALMLRAYSELLDEGFKIDKPKLGIMIEVPAAVYQISELTVHADFVSVGSNDLTQYLLAVDRNNSRVSSLYQAYHPAVLGALADIAHEVCSQKKPLSICGEIAGDPGAAVLLMAMGYRDLSMSVTNILKVKSVIRRVSFSNAKKLLQEVLELDTADKVERHVSDSLREWGVERIFRPHQKSKS